LPLLGSNHERAGMGGERTGMGGLPALGANPYFFFI
jgi:hypothetical protein